MTTLHLLLTPEDGKLHKAIDTIMAKFEDYNDNPKPCYIINAQGKRVTVEKDLIDTESNSVSDTQLYSISDAVGIRNCFYAHDYPAPEALKEYYHADKISEGPAFGTFTLHRTVHTDDHLHYPIFSDWDTSDLVNNGVIPTKILLKKYTKAESFEELLPYIPYGWVDTHGNYTQLYSQHGTLNIDTFNKYIHYLNNFADMYEDNPNVKAAGPRIAVVDIFND